MFDEAQLEKEIRDIIIDICEVMYRRGYRSVSIGAIMRLVGVDNTIAQQHDDEMYELDSTFLAILESRTSLLHEAPPPGTTIH